jgi:hypothetical protein
MRLHLAHFRIHHEGLKNLVGVVQCINRQNRALRRQDRALRGLAEAVGQLRSHLVNRGLIPAVHGVLRLETLEVDVKPGAISIMSEYYACEDARQLIVDECRMALQRLADDRALVDRISNAAAALPELNSGVQGWLNGSVRPRLQQAEAETQRLMNAVNAIPSLDDIAQIARDDRARVGSDRAY